MGSVCSELLQRVASDEAFNKRQSGPTLRRLFGAYRNPDFWAVYRRFRAIDDGNGYVSYEELLQCVSLAEHQLLFLWETFSMQNELIFARELMTVICVFSSAPLVEKGKFLQALFDDSSTGLNTAAEIVSILHMVCTCMTKCTGIPVKVKEVREQLKSILPDLLPTPWAEALERSHGKSEVAFNSDRFIGQIEMDELIPTILSSYQTLPIAGPPPAGAMQPPPPDWATPSSLEKGSAKAPDKNAVKPAAGQSAKSLSKAELAHLDWMSKMDDEGVEEGKENSPGNSRRPPAVAEEEEKAVSDPAKCWMVIYGTDFASVAKNLASFRHLFMRSVATALGLPMGCIEVNNIVRGGKAGGVVIEFLLHPSGRGGDERDGETLRQSLTQQLALPHSALRKGAFKEYVSSAEIVERPTKGARATTPAAAQPASPAYPAATPGAVPESGPQPPGGAEELARLEAENRRLAAELEKLKDVEAGNQEVLQDLEAAEAEARLWQQKAEEAIAARDAALEELDALKKAAAQ